MEFHTGDIVINPSMPQWGPGEVVAVIDGKVMVQFKRHGMRKMAASFLAMADTGECPEPSDVQKKAPAKTPSPAPQTRVSARPKTPSSPRRKKTESQDLVSRALAMLNGQEASEASPLEAAERAADLTADAKRKAEEDALRRRNAAVLRFWRDAEIFIIPEVPRSSRPPVTGARRWETVSASLPAWGVGRGEENSGRNASPASPSAPDDGPLPWFRPLPSGFAAAWHIVYLGVLPRQRISDIILEKTGSRPELPEEPGLGEGCLAAVVLDMTGMPVPESYVPAAFVPGLARCLAGKNLDQLTLDMLSMQSDFDRRRGSRAEPFRGPWIQEEIQRLFDMMDVKDEEARIVVRSVYFRPDPRGRRIDDIQNDLLNSFYLSDLDHLLAISKFGFKGVFARYLEGEDKKLERCDVLASGEESRLAREKALSLERMPMGRWPFPPKQHLLPAQLAAVTEILHGELTAVNGPPGTGKTRLLCDVAAELVVKRAERLAKLRQPYEVFVSSSGDFHVLRRDIMRGTCMVVTSSNNAAVENITRFLPSEEAVCREAFPDAGYFPEAASAVSAAFMPADSEELPRPAWGLLSAVLGSSWNCEQFERAFFWGFRDQERQISLPGMKQVLDAFRSYETRQEALRRWRQAKQDFLATAAELKRRRRMLAEKAGERSTVSEPKSQNTSLLGRFMELMEQSRVLRASAREEDSAALELAERLEALEALARRAQEEIRNIDNGEKLRFPCREFWQKSDWQLSSVWNDETLERLRSLLFLQALHLHEWTIKACAREFTADIGIITRYLRGAPVEDAECADIWNALFFMVPVVSSTLASFSRLFSGMGPGSLDWVLLDEAGQATPQSAAGALWRAARAAVIGDPQQIEPVVPQPDALLDTLRKKQEKDGVSLDNWSPETQSAQTLADRSARLGTWMESAGRRVWTGFPLRAHYRCAEPMFSVSNRIAYDGQMVQAQKHVPRIHTPLGPSCWFHVNGQTADTQLVQEELSRLRLCLLRFQEDWPVLEGKHGPKEASVFVISPFRKVARHCRSLLRAMRFPEERVRCGTIHTFQGREADIVFLVLGSAPGQAGWGSRQWASRTPNILNVALTRARSLIYVIGNRRDWQKHPFFDVLSDELPVRESADDEGIPPGAGLL